ncbi:MAG: adenylate/guanylate cyclase domain-containing protein [Acidimicrobiia bacterium]
MTTLVEAPGAVAFVDVVGFTAFTERYGNRSAVEIVDRIESVTRSTLPADACLVKLLGDGALLWFGRASTAVPATVEVVERLASGDPCVPCRASVHYGHVAWRGGDVLGRDVNVAARLCPLARSGEVLCSATARAATNPLDADFELVGNIALRGIERRIDVYRAQAHALGYTPKSSLSSAGATVSSWE